MQIEVSSGKYFAHIVSQQQNEAPQESPTAVVPSHEQLMGQLAELDKLGQEGANPVDDAEVCKGPDHTLCSSETFHRDDVSCDHSVFQLWCAEGSKIASHNLLTA